jgi:hypothetical protein
MLLCYFWNMKTILLLLAVSINFAGFGQDTLSNSRKYTKVTVDLVTNDTFISILQPLVAENSNGDNAMSIVCARHKGLIILSIYARPSECLDEKSKAYFVSPDTQRINIYGNHSFNCDGKWYNTCYVSAIHNTSANSKFFQFLITNGIMIIRVETRSGYAQATLTPEDQLIFKGAMMELTR